MGSRLLPSAPATVTVFVGDQAPQAQAGIAQTVLVGALVHLDGSASADPYRYQGSQAVRTAGAAGSRGLDRRGNLLVQRRGPS